MTENKSDPAPYQIMDVKDENQIIQEMQGETTLIDEYVYSFKQGNRQVTSLSYAGVKEMVRRRGHFEIVSMEKEETDKTIRVIVKIRDLINCVDFLGASEADKDKPFAYVLAVNKAERNAYRKAMPTELLSKMVETFLHQQKPQPPQTEQPKTEAPPKPQEQPKTEGWQQMPPTEKGAWEKNTDLNSNEVQTVLDMMNCEGKSSIDLEGYRFWQLKDKDAVVGLGRRSLM